MDCLVLSSHAGDKFGVAFPGSKMDDSTAREDACQEYKSSLEDLTFNSKPHINMLTILAEENVSFAKDIVAIIEAQISKAAAAEKLPVLYLVDSIVKNVGGEYLAVFAKNLITSFICVFEKVEENTRKSLFKLRSTWDEVFPLKKLYALDVRVNSVDPAWPIKPLPPTVNASIHVNPKFLKQSEEAPSPRPSPPQPPPTPPPPAAAAVQASLTQEQLIRQQLLAKQKQLLELQQKKIELELEQTKAQLAGGFSVLTATPGPPVATPKPVGQPTPVVRSVVAPQPPIDPKLPTRDPRLNRLGPPKGKESSAGKKEFPPSALISAITAERRAAERAPLSEKPRIPKKDDKPSLKSPQVTKTPQSKTKQPEADHQKSADNAKKDPRLKKRGPDKAGDEEQKDKKSRSAELPKAYRGRLQNGSLAKHERVDSAEKAGGNARSHARKRTRSRSRSRSPTSPKRKDRRSPKSRTRSKSLSPSPSRKPGKPRRPRGDEPPPPQGKTVSRDDRPASKKNQAEGRRPKTPADDRRAKSRDSPRSHDGGGGNQGKGTPSRWRSGWDENKHLKPGEPHAKLGPQRHKPYNTPTRPTTPRTPKHRLSVDANLQIPEALNSASKKDLLRRASKSLESGEITQEDFLNMAHKIKNFFQYQEEKQQHPETWTDDDDFPAKNATPLDQAQLTYFEHKSKLKKTQVARRSPGEGWEGLEECEGPGRPTRELAERESMEREEQRPPLAPMVEEYNHGKEFPALKGLRFRRRADPRETSEREWNSPLTERQREEQKSGYDVPRRYAESRHPDPRRTDGFHPSAAPVLRNCPSPSSQETPVPMFERERLSPLHQKDVADVSPVARFESPNSEHSDDGPLPLDAAPVIAGNVPGGMPPNVRRSPGRSPPHDGGPPLARFEPPGGHPGPSRAHPPGWYGEPPHFEVPRSGVSPHHPPERFNVPPGALRNVDNMGPFEGPGRFDGAGPGPGLFDNCGVPCYDNNLGPGPGPMGFPLQQQGMPFDNPALRQDGSGPPMLFEAHGQPGPRFELAAQGPCFDGPPGQQAPPGFPPQLTIPMRPMPPPMYENPLPPPQGFPMAPQPFPEAGVNQAFHPGGPMAFPGPPNVVQPSANFNILPGPPFGQPNTGPFFNPAVASVNMQQPVNVLNMNQPFLPHNPVPFGQPAPQMPPAENHLGQVDVNDLLSKLISTGIIKGSQPDPAAPVNELPVVAAPEAAPTEEEEEEEVEDDFPDLTDFKLDDMKLRYEGVVTKLYSGNQCCLCSMRFTVAQTDLYADHLDWHFRQNHAGKVAGRKITHRRWTGWSLKRLPTWRSEPRACSLRRRARRRFRRARRPPKRRSFRASKPPKTKWQSCAKSARSPLRRTGWKKRKTGSSKTPSESTIRTSILPVSRIIKTPLRTSTRRRRPTKY
ncbi:pre-mRNA cleavage complex 2 protein Pcf11 isoform X2 [Stigmatopora argus]